MLYALVGHHVGTSTNPCDAVFDVCLLNSPQISPLRISKATPSSSPSKMRSPFGRALGEVSVTSPRRNSPSYNQATKASTADYHTRPLHQVSNLGVEDDSFQS
jgi:hypothetical protein